ncbi:hypothetical protein [Lentzea cavernae]|uniref:Uncharacterized protein n=1 Tax=Lentzea cavernae TaxID=2020703 RepID=A0ABQ3MK07_9PSEU|nr:hypothetical protein [Lentzea cavernae]GHH48830.1 hypothetical protein GCM10017774_55250 [Lentzea cavernae]
MSDEPQPVAGEPQAEPEFGPFEPLVPKVRPGLPPDWEGSCPAASVRRIRKAATIEEAGVQATTEAVILLHSIRRILMWVLVIIPLVSAALVITLVSVNEAAEPPCTSIYGCR